MKGAGYTLRSKGVGLLGFILDGMQNKIRNVLSYGCSALETEQDVDGVWCTSTVHPCAAYTIRSALPDLYTANDIAIKLI